MRTDSPQISSQAQQEAAELIRNRYGADFVPETPPIYKSRARGAQEAHEAIRPTSAIRLPEDLRDHLTAEQHKLYSLIWRRFLASQMTAAEYDTFSVDVEGVSPAHRFALRVSASHLRFSGFLEVYEERTADEAANGEGEVPELVLARFPELEPGDKLTLVQVFPEQHFTQPPPRYTEASLVKALEEYGIGRPSTYAPILGTLQARGYVRKENKRLVPTDMGEVVNSLIVDHFPEIVDLGFTARMEEELDEIADGQQEWVDVVREFYGPFSEQVKAAELAMPELKAEPEPLGRDCPECGKPLIIRHGRYGKFIGCSAFPACRYTEPWLEKVGAKCPRDGGELVERRTRKGRVFYGCSNYPACEFVSWKKPLRVPCGQCGGLLVTQDKSQAVCLQCGRSYPLQELTEAQEDLA
jgi:DNA topoisomerase-1